jgi:hypothetical protein
MLPVATYSFSIPANGAFPLQCNGRYFRVNAATGSLKVIGDSFGPMGAVAVGQGLRLRDHDPVFQRLTFVDTSGAQNNVTVVIADADFVDNTVLGTVNVIDGGKARTLALQTFTGGTSRAPAAGQFAAVQLYNGANAGTIRAVVSQITMQSSNADGLVIYETAGSSALATVVGAFRSKKAGIGATSYANLRTDSLATITPPAIAVGNPLFQVNLPASGGYTYKLTEPIVIPGARGIMVIASSANNAIGASFEFYEEPDV